MDAVNLRGGWNMGKRRRRSHRDLRPETTGTGARMTNVRDPRSSSRFAPGEQVSWLGGESAEYIGEDPNDASFAIVRRRDGSLARWPGCLPGMRRLQTPDFGTSEGSTPSLITPIGEPVRATAESDYYDALAMEEAPPADPADDLMHTISDVFDHDETLPDGMRRR